MDWRNLISILMLAALSSAISTASAQEQTPPPGAEDQLRSEIDASIARTQEMLRKEIKQSQRETEARIYGDRIRPLEQRLNESPPWWLPILVSAFLAALGGLGGYLLSRRSAHEDWSIAFAGRKFRRTKFPEFKNSLTPILETHVGEISEAERLADDVLKTPLVRPPESLAPETMAAFKEDVWTEAVRNLELSPCELIIPEEGNRYTITLRPLFAQYKLQAEELNQCLREFSRMTRVRASFEQPDEDLLAREDFLAEHGVENSLELARSETYRTRLDAAREKIKRAAQEEKRLNGEISKELTNIEEWLRDV